MTICKFCLSHDMKVMQISNISARGKKTLQKYRFLHKLLNKH